MPRKIKLGRIYSAIRSKFPDKEHDEKSYLLNIIGELNRDPIRTTNQRLGIQSKGMDYEIREQWPLTDFIDGSLKYMAQIGIERREAEVFCSKLNSNFLFGSKQVHN